MLNEENKKNCLDCWHCKVSALSTEQKRLCFCAKTEKRKPHKETYWPTKKVCKHFSDMTDDNRRPLLKGKLYERR